MTNVELPGIAEGGFRLAMAGVKAFTVTLDMFETGPAG
jgi:hypothetical protein